MEARGPSGEERGGAGGERASVRSRGGPQKLGVDRLAKYSRLFGFGRLTGVEMEHEKAGIVPSTE